MNALKGIELTAHQTHLNKHLKKRFSGSPVLVELIGDRATRLKLHANSSAVLVRKFRAAGTRVE
ncbi:hypothetical protein [Neorhizobium sp. DAR64872/K0K18]|uniref:hypothetical protein n=1 Tax=Neorhizobium sp. DAR64872/K0K18 TaxID=3421958 RepID=UPI003D27CCE3